MGAISKKNGFPTYEIVLCEDGQRGEGKTVSAGQYDHADRARLIGNDKADELSAETGKDYGVWIRKI